MARSTIRHLVAVTTTLTLAAALTPATAAERASVGAAACTPGDHVYKVSSGKRAHRLTHVSKVRVPPKSSRAIERPAMAIRTIAAGAAGNGDFDAAAVLRAAHRKYLPGEDDVRAPGDTTSSEPVDLGRATVRNPTAQARKYAGYSAAIVVRGKWTHRVCGDPSLLASGAWRTFSAVKVSGYALCPSSRYGAHTAAGQACTRVWG
jgi:hypothetical protein